ncbi:MAG: undecaprenyl/decaprenyl-phosphate alpha-N-acetylglucosaminyl 1-phosphate transferase [Desulfuromonadales bacterium]|nr:undecaprenyl/decaprenyl-phosphate alpha-N-acetylglucosaminyl 1-phosphate transferase [Desulfuromonadales bacterium]
MGLLTCFYTFMTALFTALIIVPFLRKWALDQGTLDIPDERKMHDVPMPRLGGVAIFLSFLFAIIVYVPVTPTIRGFLAGGLIIFVTGLVDDLTELTAKRKFAGEMAACLTTIVLGELWLSDLGNLFGLGYIVLPVWVAIPFTVFAMVGVINSINLIDGLDGLAGGVSMMALAAFFMLGWIDGDQETVLLTAALAGALLGFLKYNFYPARIFMGDAGSLTVGFILGFLAVHTIQQPTSTVSPVATVVILALPLFDTLWVMTRRIIRGENPFAADRSHLHHKFLDLGFEHRFTVVIIYSITLFWTSCALFFRTAPDYLLLLFLFGTAALFYLCLRHVLRHPEQFAFLSRDTSGGIRTTVTYQHIANLIDRLVPGLFYLLAGYLVLALWSSVAHMQLAWQVAPVLLAVGGFLWFRPLTENRQFLLLVIYVAFGMATLEVWHADQVIFSGLSIKRAGDILLAVAGMIVVFKIQFRRQGEFFLSTADYLTLAVCVFLSIATQHNALGFNLDGPLFRTVVVILIVRTLCSSGMHHYRLVAWSAFLFLALVSVVGLIA